MLDPFPFGMGVTALEALSVGTPVVTLPSYQVFLFMSVNESFHSFHAQFSAQTVLKLVKGFLTVADVTELIAESPSDFMSIAHRLITDASFKGRIRRQLRDSVPRRLFDNQAANSVEWNRLIWGLSRSREMH